jgi:hypothetical protein
MGICPNCGRKKVFLQKAKCRICGKLGCEECFNFLFRVIDRNSAFDDPWYSCSETCFEKISSQIENHISPNEIIAEPKMPPVRFFVEREILGQYTPKGSSSFMGQIMNRIDNKELYIAFNRYPNSAPPHDNVLWNRLAKCVQLVQASHFETLREFENAAEIYKSLGMYEKAGKTRAKRDEVTVKKTDISFNLNALLQQVKDGGIVAIYRCPHCNGKLKVGGKTALNSLRTCEHCGSEIEAVDLVDFLKTALS